MNFVQYEFLVLMATVFVLYWGVRNRVMQNVILVVTSLIFYGWVHPWFLYLLGFSAILDYSVGRLTLAFPDRKKWWLALSIAGNMGMLAFFKYYNFFVENVKVAFESAGIGVNLSTLDILLPVGISFYTFQTMSYTIDIYRGQLKPRTNFLDYLVYVGFFPQLVAGPIERASNLIPQVEKVRVWNTDRILSGFGLAMWGGFKKVCIADVVAQYVDKVHMLEEPSAALVWAAVAGFGVQILADFSGYTDIARGTSRMLGFELVENFNRPYIATSTPDFWRRWHMSLSSWIADYVYVPLVRGGKAGVFRLTWAMMLTFFLIGLWHGASWNFIVLGVWHGFFMVAYTLGTPLVPRKIRRMPGATPLAILFHTIVVVGPGGLIFREVNLERVVQHLSQPIWGGTQEQWVAASIVAGVALATSMPMMIAVLVEDNWLPKLRTNRWFLPIQTTFWTAEAVLIFVFYRNTMGDFIYFQF
jgi:D-alanyl-lipoteichoic acid acyltransferase DltB (MBOAT superfamily)